MVTRKSGAGVGEAVTPDVIRQFRSFDDAKLQRLSRGGLSDQQTALARTIISERQTGTQVSQRELTSRLAEQRQSDTRRLLIQTSPNIRAKQRFEAQVEQSRKPSVIQRQKELQAGKVRVAQTRQATVQTTTRARKVRETAGRIVRTEVGFKILPSFVSGNFNPLKPDITARQAAQTLPTLTGAVGGVLAVGSKTSLNKDVLSQKFLTGQSVGRFSGEVV